jgi:feruloyl esterase
VTYFKFRHLPLSILAVILLVAASAAAQQPCESLMSLSIPNVTIASAKALEPGWELPAQTGFINAPPTKISAPACRVMAFSAPSSDSHIGIEVWLPVASNWNGKFLAAGNPGFIGSIASAGLAGIAQRGFVAAGTDTGHVDERSDWAIGHPEKWADWGYRAVHEMATVTKELAKAYYGKSIRYSFWNSCHNGGNQGLNEAQRYPDDFDGIVAGDPAFYISHLQPGSLYLSWVALKDGLKAPGYIPPAKYAVLNRAALDACDGNDGIVDGLIIDPPHCKFDPKSIECPGNNDSPSCLTAEQVETAKKIYAGAKFKDGTPIYSGFEPGSELSWNLIAEKEPFWVNVDYFKGMVFQDPNWDWKTLDIDRDTRLAEERTGKYVDGNNPDLRPFKKSGGKIVLYESWNSTGLPPRQLALYYENVVKAIGGLKETQDFARLFMVPGSSGCPGFMSAEDFKSLDAMMEWVEKGTAPEKIDYAQRDSQRKVFRTRPVCAYPKTAKYKGSGDPNDAASFDCVH